MFWLELLLFCPDFNWTELIVFIVSGMICLFGFRRKAILIARWCFSSCWAVSYTEPKAFQFLVLSCQWAGLGVQGAGRGQNQGSWPNLAKGIFHSTWHHGGKNYKTEGSWLGGVLLLGNCLGIGQQVVSICFVHHLFCNYIYTCILYFSVLVNCFISTYKFNLYFWFFSPSHWGGGDEWKAVWCSSVCWVKSHFCIKIFSSFKRLISGSHSCTSCYF